MKFHKVTLVLLLTAGLLYSDSHENRGPHGNYPVIKLEHPVLEFVDGKKGMGIDEKVLGMMIHLRNEMKKMLFGIRQKDGTFVGTYEYNGIKYSLMTLIDLEDEALARNDTATLSDLKKILEIVKIDFGKKVEPFLKDAQGAKGPMIKLIGEWAQKTARHDSHLLDWVSTPEGKEADAFIVRGTSLKIVAQFVSDLAHFLETLSRSCPKAAAQLKELMEKQKLNNAVVNQ